MSDAWIAFLGSVAGGIIGGLFTFIGVKLTLSHQDNEKRKEALKKDYDTRPRLELKEFKDLGDADVEDSSDLDCIVLRIENVEKDDKGRFHFQYDKNALSEDNLCCVEYTFLNTGGTEIDGICIVSDNPKDTAIFRRKDCPSFIKKEMLSYEAWSDRRFIKPRQQVTVKVCYVKGKVIVPFISSVATIYLQDINGNLWQQPLFCPCMEVENSTRVSYEEFKAKRDIKTALECFENPELW